MIVRLFAFLLATFFSNFLFSQTRTVGLLEYEKGHESRYYLYTPLSSKSTFLINECGDAVRTWTSNYTSGTAQLLSEDGSLYRCGLVSPPRFGLGSGGVIERFDWNGNKTWTFLYSDTSHSLHHDISLMPNGNILAIVWEYISTTDAIAKGRKSQLASPSIWGERIIEIKPIGTDSFDIVWEWAAIDHIVQNTSTSKPNYGNPSDHPELFDINYVGPNFQDWFHINSVDYNAELDQIVLSAHSTDEIFIIDHSTSTVQSAGHQGGKYGKGGDILYRWGNPQSYGLGGDTDRKLFKQHHAHWIPTGKANAGKIMVFNNGSNRIGSKYSSIDIVEPPTTRPGFYTFQSGSPYGPANSEIVFVADPATSFYAMNLSGVYSIDNGLLITSGPQGTFFEIDAEGNVIWKYTNPVNGTGAIAQGTTPTGNNVFRCVPYQANFKGFEGKSMVAAGPLESSPLSPSLCESAAVPESPVILELELYPNPVVSNLHVKGLGNGSYSVVNVFGQVLIRDCTFESVDLSNLTKGVYFIKYKTNNNSGVLQFIKE